LIAVVCTHVPLASITARQALLAGRFVWQS